MRPINNEYKKVILRIVRNTAIGLLLMLLLFAYARFSSRVQRQIDLGTNNKDMRFTYIISKEWSEKSHGYRYGAEYDFEVENISLGNMRNWYIELALGENYHIDSNWNGEFVDNSDGVITITSLDFNDTIDSGEVQPFGMVAYSEDEDIIIGGKLVYYEEKRLVDMPMFWGIIAAYIITLTAEISSVFYIAKNLSLEEKEKAAFRIINQSFITFANTIDAKDSYTKGHSQRVAYYARELSRRLGYDEEFGRNIFYVGLLHDIGKIGVQDAILKKDTMLTYDEFNEIKEHVSMGGDILTNFTAIPGIEAGARYHHERYDGTGYMAGLAGEAIPMVARIISVADAFDAMASERCYRPAMAKEIIIDELKNNSGKQFDPNIVCHMIDMINEGVVPVEFSQKQLEEELELQ